jgi:hypothetical protein
VGSFVGEKGSLAKIAQTRDGMKRLRIVKFKIRDIRKAAVAHAPERTELGKIVVAPLEIVVRKTG